MGTSYGYFSITFDTSDNSLSGPAAGASASISLSYSDTNGTVAAGDDDAFGTGTVS